MLIPSWPLMHAHHVPSLSRRGNANSQLSLSAWTVGDKLIKKGEC